jgi:DNA-binding PadR family transcriptional regulator
MHPDTEEKTTANWMKEAQKGYIRIAVLILLSKTASHGYEIMKDIKDKTGGFYKPTPGGVYPILRSLENSGYVKGDWCTQRNRKIKVYKITESGKHILNHALIKQSEIAKNLNCLFEEFARDVLNIEPQMLPMPIMHSPFSAFLGEETGKTKLNIEELEQQRNNLRSTICMMQEKLQSLDKEVAEAKQQDKKSKESARESPP